MLLALDSCFNACSVALQDGQRVVASQLQVMDKGHAEALPKLVAACCDEAGVKLADVTRIAVTQGPGTFTGQRIGLAYAHGVATALGIPCLGIDSLTAIAIGAGETVFVAQKAGATGMLYCGGAMEPQYLSPGHAATRIPAGTKLVGSGANTVMQFGNFDYIPGHEFPVAAKFAAHAATLPFPSQLPQPLYLREHDAKPAAPFEPVRIRQADASDFAQMSALHGMSFSTGWTETQLRDALSLSGAFALVAEINGKVRAVIQLQAVADEAEIHTICTEPRQRRRGLAKRLLDAAMVELQKRGVKTLFLEVAEDNAAARALYAALGFVENGRRKNYYARSGAHIDAVLLRRSVVR